MTPRKKLHPGNPDIARAQADTNFVFQVFGRTRPKSAKLAAARTRELARVISVLEEVSRMDKLDAVDILPPMPAYPAVMRGTVYTDNVKPAVFPRFGKKPKA